MLVLTREDVRSLVPMEMAIGLMGVAFGDLSAGLALSPLRTSLDVLPGAGTTLVMPAYVPSSAALGLKVVSVFTGNPARGLPTITSLVCLLDDETGQPLAIMDGGYLTALRTGAVAGAASNLLARTDSKVLTVIGAGAQALTQVAAICAVRPIERAIVTARSEASLDLFRQRLSAEWPDLVDRLETSVDIAAAVRAADIICTATTSRTPVFDDADLQPGTHINGVGSFTPQMQEIPAQTVSRALIVVDQRGPALEEAGDLIIPLRDGLISDGQISRELGQLLNGDVTGRTADDQITFFKSVGNAVQDMAVGRFAFDEARRLGAGQSVRL
jgi:ornithine cyclodeaminase/alanine dehydrogenase-like protein (mu-crystallin family)